MFSNKNNARFCKESDHISGLQECLRRRSFVPLKNFKLQISKYTLNYVTPSKFCYAVFTLCQCCLTDCREILHQETKEANPDEISRIETGCDYDTFRSVLSKSINGVSTESDDELFVETDEVQRSKSPMEFHPVMGSLQPTCTCSKPTNLHLLFNRFKVQAELSLGLVPYRPLLFSRCRM